MERVNLTLIRKDIELAKKKCLRLYGCGMLSPLVRHLLKNFLRQSDNIKTCNQCHAVYFAEEGHKCERDTAKY